MARNILVVGHSHIEAVRRAAILRREADPQRPRTRTLYLLDPMFGGELSPDADRFSDGIQAAVQIQIERHAPLIASAIGGNSHNSLVMVPTRRFDFVLGGESADDSLPLDEGAEILTEGEVRSMLLGVMRPELSKLVMLRIFAGPFWHLESPPPVRSTEWMMANMEAAFTSRPEYGLLGIAPAGLRYRIWRLACRIVREECVRLGCGYVPVPQHMRGAAGLLRPSQAKDSTHGNLHFGEAMLQALETMAT